MIHRLSCMKISGLIIKSRGFTNIQHKRSARYEILLAFVTRKCREKQEYFRELLTYDYYLRENAKTRPDFAGEVKHSKEAVRKFLYDGRKRAKILR